MPFLSALDPMPAGSTWDATVGRLPGCAAFAFLLFIALSLIPPVGKAQTVDEAEQLYLAGDYARALAGFRGGAALGSATAQFYLGVMHANGLGVQKDDREAVRWYRLAAEQGNAAAQFNLGVMHENGRGALQDDREAVRWYRLAAEQGNAAAQFNLGVMHGEGRGVPKDEREAVRWYRLAADQGNATAQFNLGVMHANGRGVPKDDREAVRWFRLAAEQGYAAAQFNLGVMHSNGTGTTKDDREAVRWYRLAAERGIAAAQLNLGVMHANGRGVPKDDREAVRWYRLAAEQGNAAAQFNLGVMHANGLGVQKDDQAAYFWLLLSTAQGSADAARERVTVSIRDQIESRLSPQQRAQARAETRVWKPKASVSAAAISAPSSIASTPTASATPALTGTGVRIGQEAVVQRSAARESVSVLGQSIVFSNPSGYCTPGTSAREADLMEVARRSVGEGSHLVHAAVRCSELEDYREGRREMLDHWLVIHLIGPKGNIRRIDMPREAFLSGLSKESPQVNAEELNRRLRSSFENRDINLADMRVEPIGRDGNAVYFSMRMNLGVREISRPITGVGGVTLLNSLPLSINVYEGTGSPKSRSQLQVVVRELLHSLLAEN